MKIIMVWMIFVSADSYKTPTWNSPPMPTAQECERVKKAMGDSPYSRCIEFKMLVKE